MVSYGTREVQFVRLLVAPAMPPILKIVDVIPENQCPHFNLYLSTLAEDSHISINIGNTAQPAAISLSPVPRAPLEADCCSMSKKFKSQASSTRAASAAFGSSSFAFGSSATTFQTAPSTLSYITEQPNLSGISDPNVVVLLRNLSKKDSTTKAKALEELQEHVTGSAATGVIEPALLEAWVCCICTSATGTDRIPISDQSIPACIHRQLSKSSATCTYAAGFYHNHSRKAHCTASAQSYWTMVGWCI
jgi:hypothetical protein